MVKGRRLILTLQGTLAAVRQIEEPVLTFLKSRPGLRHCSIKREDITNYWLSTPSIKRAPILTKVHSMQAAI